MIQQKCSRKHQINFHQSKTYEVTSNESNTFSMSKFFFLQLNMHVDVDPQKQSDAETCF